MVKLRSQLLFGQFTYTKLALTWPSCSKAVAQTCWALLLPRKEDALTSSATVGGRIGSGSSGTAGLLPWGQHITYHCGCGAVPLPQKQTLEIPREKVMEDLQLKFYWSLSLHTLLGRDFFYLSSNQRHCGATSFAHTCSLPCLQLLLLEQQGKGFPCLSRDLSWAKRWVVLGHQKVAFWRELVHQATSELVLQWFCQGLAWNHHQPAFSGLEDPWQ